MAEQNKKIRLIKAAREFNVGISTIVEFLSKKGHTIESNPNTKLSPDIYDILLAEFQGEKNVKEKSKKIDLDHLNHKTISIEDTIDHSNDIESEVEKDELFIKNVPFLNDEALETKEIKKEVEEIEKKRENINKIIKPFEEKQKDKHLETEELAEENKPEEPVEPAQEEKHIEKAEDKVSKLKEEKTEKEKPSGLKIVGKINLNSKNFKTKPPRKTKEEKRRLKEMKKQNISTSSLVENKKVKETKPLQKKENKKVFEKPSDKVKENKKITLSKQKEKQVEPEKINKQKIIEEEKKEDNFIKTKIQKLKGPTIVGSIKLPHHKKKSVNKKPIASSSDEKLKEKKKKRKRINKHFEPVKAGHRGARDYKTSLKFNKRKISKREIKKPEPTEEEIQKKIRETLAKLSSSGKSKASKHRREKRNIASKHTFEELQKHEKERKIIKVTEFVTANELATMINVPVNDIISTCMTLGIFVSINQRLDAETLILVAEEFGYEVKFVSVDVQEAIHHNDEKENLEDLRPRAPIVTVMGHVDHGKTSLLDYIRHTNVIAGESGGITQHIGSYEVTLTNGKKITFLDTPGHEAFTAMRARGAKVTDIAIIIIASDDAVMPQTIEAINHAQAAGVPIVFAINKIDKPNANPKKIKEELSKHNILVEDWGGKYQSQEISAKKGTGIDDLLEKVLLEAEMLDLKGNPKKKAVGTVLESSLDKGRGYVVKLLVADGTLRVGDVVLAGSYFGRVKAMYNERNALIKEAGPSTPLLLLGLNGPPQAGDAFNVMSDEKESRAIANKRLQLQREQGIRTQKHITLDEIGRRIAIGDFKELNIIVKGDADGSIEALSDSLLKLSTQQVQVNVIHKSVGQVTESDVLLASASNAIIICFQVRPSLGARKLAEREQIDIRLYSVIYKAIDEIRLAIEGMLSPEIEEKIVCNIEVREIFKISKVGTVAGCKVLDGKINRKTNVRIIRDGIVVYTGKLGSLKRFKDDVKEVQSGFECGLNIENFNDIKVGDIIEGYEEIEVKRKLK